jgi:hypothetical protein
VRMDKFETRMRDRTANICATSREGPKVVLRENPNPC